MLREVSSVVLAEETTQARVMLRVAGAKQLVAGLGLPPAFGCTA